MPSNDQAPSTMSNEMRTLLEELEKSKLPELGFYLGARHDTHQDRESSLVNIKAILMEERVTQLSKWRFEDTQPDPSGLLSMCDRAIRAEFSPEELDSEGSPKVRPEDSQNGKILDRPKRLYL